MRSTCMLSCLPAHRPSSLMPTPSPSCPHATRMARPTPARQHHLSHTPQAHRHATPPPSARHLQIHLHTRTPPSCHLHALMPSTPMPPHAHTPTPMHTPMLPQPCMLSHINLAWNNVQLLTPHLSPYLNTDSLFVHGFPSFIQ